MRGRTMSAFKHCRRVSTVSESSKPRKRGKLAASNARTRNGAALPEPGKAGEAPASGSPARQPSAAPDEPATRAYNTAFPVVGIGASAGGIAAFEAFFAAMPSNDSGMAFVLVQHLSPDHKSVLVDLIQRSTRM